MSKVISRFCFMFVLLLVFVFTLSGCNLWTLNEQKVLNQTAAKLNSIEVTYEDVYNAYNSYGNYYFDSQGTPTYKGMESTATQLINRKLLVEALKDEDGEYYTELTPAQKNEVWNSIYKTINTTLFNYEKSLMETDDKTLPSFNTDEEEESENTEDYEKEYAAYEKTYKCVFVFNPETEQYEYKLEKIVKEQEEVTTSDDVFQFTEKEMAGFNTLEEKLDSMTYEKKVERIYNNFRSIYWNHKDDTYTNSKGELYNELAFKKMISILKSNEKGKNLSTDSKEVFYRYFKDLFKTTYESKLITAFEENFKATDQISEELVLTTFNDLASTQAQKYRNSYNNYASFVSAMKNKSAPMLYFEKTNEWFQVSHVLLKFSDEDVQTLKTLKQELEDGKILLETYNRKVAQVKAAMKFVDRKTNNKYSALEVLQMLQNDMGISVDGAGKVTYSTSVTPEQRIQIFNDYIYRFNMDAGANNAELAYYIPTDQANDSMVTPFANESRRLHDTTVVGSISSLIEVNEIDGYIDNNDEKQTPGYSGYHIIVYLGEIQTLPTNKTATLSDLNNYVLNPLNNNDTNQKTMLDYVIEQISIDNSSNHESSVLANLKGTNKISYYSNVLNDLVKAFS